MKDDFLEWLITQGASYQVRYRDYEEGQFTVPVTLTKDRANSLYDLSIVEIRFYL